MKNIKIYKSPIGFTLLKAENGYITNIRILEDNEVGFYNKDVEEHEDNINVLNECMNQLDEYFLGKRKTFDFKFNNVGTEFRKKVWKEIEKVPYGTTVSYKDLAVAVNNPKAVRAVGGANHNNNIWIVVPCHRIIGSNGSLTGYGGGIWRKEWLLNHEKRYI